MKTTLLSVLALVAFVASAGVAHAEMETGRLLASGSFLGVNGQACRGTAVVFEQAGSGGGCEYVVGLQHFSVTGSASLEIVPLVGNADLTPPYFMLRDRAGSQSYVFRGTCGAVWQQIEIVDLSRSLSEQTACVATLEPAVFQE